MTDCLYGNNLSIEKADENLRPDEQEEEEEKVDQSSSTTSNDEENNNSKSQFTAINDDYSNSTQNSNLTPSRRNIDPSTNFLPPQFLMANPFMTGGHFGDSGGETAPQNFFVTPQYYRQLLQEYMEKLTSEQEKSVIDGRTGLSPASEPGEVVYDDIKESMERLELRKLEKTEEQGCMRNDEIRIDDKEVDEDNRTLEEHESNTETIQQSDESIARNELSPKNDEVDGSSVSPEKTEEKETNTIATASVDNKNSKQTTTTPVSPESRTAVLIKKQMNEIEKQLKLRSQNENIKKIDPSEIHEFLTDTTSTTNNENHLSSENATVNGFHANFAQPQSFTPQHPAAAFYNAAHLFHLLRMQQNDNTIPWDGKLNNSMFNSASSPEKDAKTLAELAAAATATPSPVGGANFRPDFGAMPHAAYFQAAAAAAAFPQSLQTAPFLTPNGQALGQQQPGFVQAHFPQVANSDASPGLPQIAPGAYLPLLAAAAASQWPQAAAAVLTPPSAAHHQPISLANFAPAFYPPFFVDPRSIYQQQQQTLHFPQQQLQNSNLNENFRQQNNFTVENSRNSRAASNPPVQAMNFMHKYSDSVLHTDKGSLTNLQSFSSSYDDLRQTDSNSLYSSHSHNINNSTNNSHNHNRQVIPETDDSSNSNPTSPHNNNNISNGGPPRSNSDHRDVRMSSETNSRCDDPVWVLRESYVRKLPNNLSASRSPIQNQSKSNACQTGHADSDTDTETDNLLGLQRLRKYQKVPTNDHQCSPEPKTNNISQQVNKQKKKKEVMIHEPAVLIEGVLFRAKYLGSTQILCDGRPTKASRMMQAQEAVTRIKLPDGETQPCTDVDLFISTEKIMVLNTDMQRISETDVRQDIMMDHPLRTISYIADIADLVVLMARRVSQASPDEAENIIKKTPKLICHVFESDEAQFIAQSIGQAFQVAYMEFLRANGIEDPGYLREMDYQEVLNSQEMLGEELELFARKETQKDVVVPKQKNEILGMVIVESGWGSMLPTVVVANLMPGGPAARCNQINVGDHIIAVNGISFVGLPLAKCQEHIKNVKQCTAVRMTMVHTPPVVEVRIKRPDTKYQLGFSVQNGVICSLLRGGIAERGGIRVGHRIIEINGQSVVAVAHEKIVTMLATAVGEIQMKTMPTSMFRLLTGQEQPIYI